MWAGPEAAGSASCTVKSTKVRALSDPNTIPMLGRLCVLSHVRLFATPCVVTRQAPEDAESILMEYLHCCLLPLGVPDLGWRSE